MNPHPKRVRDSSSTSQARVVPLVARSSSGLENASSATSPSSVASTGTGIGTGAGTSSTVFVPLPAAVVRHLVGASAAVLLPLSAELLARVGHALTSALACDAAFLDRARTEVNVAVSGLVDAGCVESAAAAAALLSTSPVSAGSATALVTPTTTTTTPPGRTPSATGSPVGQSLSSPSSSSSSSSASLAASMVRAGLAHAFSERRGVKRAATLGSPVVLNAQRIGTALHGRWAKQRAVDQRNVEVFVPNDALRRVLGSNDTNRLNARSLRIMQRFFSRQPRPQNWPAVIEVPIHTSPEDAQAGCYVVSLEMNFDTFHWKRKKVYRRRRVFASRAAAAAASASSAAAGPPSPPAAPSSPSGGSALPRAVGG